MSKIEKNKLRDAILFNDIKEIILNSVKLYSENIAFVTKIKAEDDNISYVNHTYKDLLKDVYAFGTSLFKRNFKDKRIAVIGRNRYEWVVAHLSNLFGGIVSIPLDKELKVNELEDSLIRSEADAIVFDEKYIENINVIKENNKTNIKNFICMSSFEGYECLNDYISEGNKEIENGYVDFIEHKVDADRMSILLFTSGTTSKSKAVMLNQRGIAVNICDMQMVEGIQSTDTNIAFLPFHHIFGSTGMLVMLACGVRTVFPDGLRYIKQNLQEYGVSLFVGVPILVDKMYDTIMKEIKKQNKEKLIKFALKISNLLMFFHIDIRRKLFKQIIDQLGGKLRMVISGGAPLDKNVAKGFNDFGIHLAQGYGLTETSPVIAAENDKYLRAGSIGFPMRSVTAEFVDKDEEGIGELRVKGPNIMLGYYKNEELTNEVIRDGWFYTGDLGYYDKDGFIFLTGRKKDVIVLKNGKKVFPEELEILVNKIPGVVESFVYGMPENNDKNDLKVSVEIVYDKKECEKIIADNGVEIRDYLWGKVKELNQSFPSYKYIKNMELSEEPLIKTTTNKIKRNEEIKKFVKN